MRNKAWPLHSQQLTKSLSRPVYSAFHGACRASANLGGLFVAEALGTYENDGFALGRSEFGERPQHVLIIHPSILRGRVSYQEKLFVSTINEHVAVLTPEMREKGIAQDGEQPCPEVGTFLKGIQVRPCSEDGVLRQIISEIHIAAERYRECAKVREECDQVTLDSERGHVLSTLDQLKRSNGLPRPNEQGLNS